MRTEQIALPIAAAPGIGLRLVRTISQMWRLWSNRRAMRRLSDLTDWELVDIGLTREDIARAYEGSIFDDPTRRLEKIARDRARDEGTARRHP